MLAVPVTDDVLAEAEEDVDGNAKELALALIGMGTADIGSGSSSLRFAAAGGSLAVGRTACEETSKWHSMTVGCFLCKCFLKLLADDL
ncbi:hypothetical protein AVEN_132012-1 [Araneus ventricosus]|uniref:Uncharacterized protein n=1 Tax=Araneus ventricosus TaxID=182803 RepID=A0A4Y2B286_ARAVE|nr:hypothetical protein AVEN_132012-1 [Araneus ventricosus]